MVSIKFKERSEDMLGSRRGKSCIPTLVGIIFVLFGIYGYYVYYQLKEKSERADNKLNYLVKRQISLKSQLQVVYEHRSKLEAALLKQRTDHKATKHDFAAKMSECSANLTRAKQEAMNRFNALDTEHRMQKARHEEVVTDFDRLQQQYVRLTKDHQQIVTGHKEDYEKLKDAKEHESKSLRERVETLHKESTECLSEKRKYSGYYQSERNERLRLGREMSQIKSAREEAKEEIITLKEHNSELETKLKNAEDTIQALHKQIADSSRASENNREDDRNDKDNKNEDILPTTISQRHQTEAITTAAAPLAPTTASPRQKTTLGYHNQQIVEKSQNIPKRNALLSKPSDKVQDILISKTDIDPEAMNSKKEDSIKDQYEVSETPDGGDSKMEVKTEPPTEEDGEHEPEGEVNFQNLVKSGIALNGGERSKGPFGVKGVGEREIEAQKPLAITKAQEKKTGSKGHKKTLGSLLRPDVDQEISLKRGTPQKPENPLKREIPRSKEDLKAMKNQESLEKDDSEGASFLKRQQQLLHRPIAKVEDKNVKKTEETEENEEEKSNHETQREKNQNEEPSDKPDVETETFNSKDRKEKPEEKTANTEDEQEQQEISQKGRKIGKEKKRHSKQDKIENDLNSNELEHKNDQKRIISELASKDQENVKENDENQNDVENDLDNNKIKAKIHQKKQIAKRELRKEEYVKNKANIIRNQIRPPKSNLGAKGDTGLDDQKPQKQRQQLRAPMAKRASYGEKSNELEEQEVKTNSQNRKNGQNQLHAPIKPQRSNANKNKPETQETHDGNRDVQDEKEAIPNDSHTHEDDENGDQALNQRKWNVDDEPENGIGDREDEEQDPEPEIEKNEDNAN